MPPSRRREPPAATLDHHQLRDRAQRSEAVSYSNRDRRLPVQILHRISPLLSVDGRGRGWARNATAPRSAEAGAGCENGQAWQPLHPDQPDAGPRLHPCAATLHAVHAGPEAGTGCSTLAIGHGGQCPHETRMTLRRLRSESESAHSYASSRRWLLCICGFPLVNANLSPLGTQLGRSCVDVGHAPTARIAAGKISCVPTRRVSLHDRRNRVPLRNVAISPAGPRGSQSRPPLPDDAAGTPLGHLELVPHLLSMQGAQMLTICKMRRRDTRG